MPSIEVFIEKVMQKNYAIRTNLPRIFSIKSDRLRYRYFILYECSNTRAVKSAPAIGSDQVMQLISETLAQTNVDNHVDRRVDHEQQVIDVPANQE